MSRIRTLHATLVMSAFLVMAGCGGARVAAPSAQTAPIGASLPDVTALDRAPDHGDTAGDALLASFVWEALGSPEAAVDELVAADGFGDPTTATARLQRLHSLAGEVEAIGEHIAPLLDAPAPNHPWGRVLHAGLAHRAANDAWRLALDPELPDAAPFGTSDVWRVAGPFSGSDVAHADRSFEPEGDTSLAETYELPAGSVRSHLVRGLVGSVFLPRTEAGVYYLEAFLTVDTDTEALIATSSPGRYTVLIDGVEVLSRGVDSTYDAQTRLTRVWLPAGHHRVLVRSATSGGVRALWMRVLPDAPADLTYFGPEPVGPTAGGVRAGEVRGVAPLALMSGLSDDPDTVDWLVRASIAGVTADANAAVAMLEDLADRPMHPLRALSVETLADVAWSRRPSERDGIVITHLSEASAAWPDAAAIALSLARRYIDEGQLDAAESALEQATMLRPDASAVQRTRAEYARLQGWDALWREAARAALAAGPGQCRTLQDVVDDRIDRTGTIDVAEMPAGWQRCDGAVEDLVRAYHLSRGEVEEALSLLRDLVSRSPNNEHARELLVDLLVGRGEFDEAQALLDEGLLWGQSPVDVRAAELDLAVARGQSPGPAVEALLDAAPTLPGAHELAVYFDGTRMLERLRLDGLQAVREFEASGATYGGSIVYVLDYAVQSYLEDGSGIEIVHQVTRLQSRDALGGYGEVGIPDDATLLTVRTIKADGRTLVPEDIAGKDSISMPNLEIGDYIELEWARRIRTGDAREAIARSWRFYFGTLDGAMHRSIAAYDLPATWRDGAEFDVRAFSGTREESATDDRWTVTFTMEGVPPVLPEPRAPNADEWMPSVRFGYGLSWERLARAYGDRVARVTTLTPELREAARAITEGASSDRERARLIFRAVNDDITDLGGFFSDPAIWTWSSGEGERLALAFALLDAAGLEPEVAFVRPAEQDQLDSAVIDDSVWDLTALVVRAGGDEIWMEPEFDEYPFDYLRPEAQGMRAFIVAGPRAGRFVTTPTWPLDAERTAIALEVAFDPSGDATVSGAESFPLRTAGSIRMVMSTIDDPAQLERQLEAGLVSSFGRVQLHEYTFEGLEDADAPLDMTYLFDVAGMARADGDALVWDGAIYERPLHSAYASQDFRTLPLAIVLPMFERMQVEFVAPDGYVFDEVPPSQDLTWGESVVSQHWERVADGHVRLTRIIELPIQRVSAEAYPEFADFLRTAQAGERAVLTMRPQ